MRHRRGPGLDLGEVGLQMGATALGLGDHRLEPADLLAEARDLPVDPGERVANDRLALVGVARRSEALTVAGTGGLVLEQLADLGEAEPGVVAEALDEPKAIEVILVVEPVRALGAGGGLEHPELLVVANRAGGQPDLGRDLLDPEEVRRRWRVDVEVAHEAS